MKKMSGGMKGKAEPAMKFSAKTKGGMKGGMKGGKSPAMKFSGKC